MMLLVDGKTADAGRCLLQAERQEETLALFRRAVEMGLPDELLFRTMWDIAATCALIGRSQ